MFGRVIGTTMTAADAIAAVPTWNASGLHSALTDLLLTAGLTASPARDGMPKLLKYALGLNPRQANAVAAAPILGTVIGALTLTYIRPPGLTDISYLVEVSSDLQVWNSGAGHTQTVSITPLDAQHEQVVVRDLTSLGGTFRRFIRLRVTQP